MRISEEKEKNCRINHTNKEFQQIYSLSHKGLSHFSNAVMQDNKYQNVMEECSINSSMNTNAKIGAYPFNADTNDLSEVTDDVVSIKNNSISREDIYRNLLGDGKSHKSLEFASSKHLSENPNLFESICSIRLSIECINIDDAKTRNNAMCDQLSNIKVGLNEDEFNTVLDSRKEEKMNGELLRVDTKMSYIYSAIDDDSQTPTEGHKRRQNRMDEVITTPIKLGKDEMSYVISEYGTSGIREKDENLSSLFFLRNSNKVSEVSLLNNPSKQARNSKQLKINALSSASCLQTLESEKRYCGNESESLNPSKYNCSYNATSPAVSSSYNSNHAHNIFLQNVKNMCNDLIENFSTLVDTHSTSLSSSLNRNFNEDFCELTKSSDFFTSSLHEGANKEGYCNGQILSTSLKADYKSSVGIDVENTFESGATSVCASSSDFMWWKLLFNGSLYDPNAPPPSAFSSLLNPFEMTNSQQRMMCEDSIKALGLIRPEWKRREYSRPYWWHRCNLAPHIPSEQNDILGIYTNIFQSLFNVVGVNMLSKKLPIDIIVGHLKELEYISATLIDDEGVSNNIGNTVIDDTLSQLNDLAKNNMVAVSTPSSSIFSALLPQDDIPLIESGGKAYNFVSRSISTRGLSRAISANSVGDFAEDDSHFLSGYQFSLDDSSISHGNYSRKHSGKVPPGRIRNLIATQDVDLSVVPSDLEFERYVAELEPGSKVKIQRDLFFKNDSSQDSQIMSSSIDASYIEAVVASIHRSLEGHHISFRFSDSKEKIIKSASEFINLCTIGAIKIAANGDLDKMDPQKFLAASYASASRTRWNAGTESQTGLKKKFIGKHRPSPPGTENHCKCKFSNARAELAAKLRNIIRNSPERFKECCANTPDLLHIQFQNARTYQLEILAYLMNVDPWKYAINPQDKPSKADQEKIVVWYKEAINSVAYNKLVREWEQEQSLLKANAALEENNEQRFISRQKNASLLNFQKPKLRTSRSLIRLPSMQRDKKIVSHSEGNVKKAPSENSGTEGSEIQCDNEDASVSTKISNSSSIKLRKQSLAAINPGVIVKFRNMVIANEINKENSMIETAYGTIVSLEVDEDEGSVLIKLNDVSKRTTFNTSNIILTVKELLNMIEAKDLVVMGNASNYLLRANETASVQSERDKIRKTMLNEKENSDTSLCVVPLLQNNSIKHEKDIYRRKGVRLFSRRMSSSLYNGKDDDSEWEQEDVTRPRKAKLERNDLFSKKADGIKYRVVSNRSVRIKREVGYSSDRLNGAEAISHIQPSNLSNTASDYTVITKFIPPATKECFESQQFEETLSQEISWAPVQSQQVKRRGRPPLKPTKSLPAVSSPFSSCLPSNVKPFVEVVFHQGKGRPRTDGKQTTGYWEVTGNYPENVVFSKKFEVKDFNGDKEFAWKAAEKEKQRIDGILAQKSIASQNDDPTD